MIHNAFWIPYITLPPGIYSYNAYMGYVCFRVINLIWITSMLKPQNKFETNQGHAHAKKVLRIENHYIRLLIYGEVC